MFASTTADPSRPATQSHTPGAQPNSVADEGDHSANADEDKATHRAPDVSPPKSRPPQALARDAGRKSPAFAPCACCLAGSTSSSGVYRTVSEIGFTKEVLG